MVMLAKAKSETCMRKAINIMLDTYFMRRAFLIMFIDYFKSY